MMEQDAVLCVDLGGTRMRVALFDSDGAIIHKSVTPTPRERPGALAEAMRAAVSKTERRVVGAAVGVPGPISYSGGTAVRLPNLPGWEPYVAVERLHDALGLPVLLANDADLAALGEHRYGAGRGTADMVYVTSSTGVGAGVIIGGHLLHAQLSLAEAGHMIIDRESGDTVEDLGSGTAIEEAAGTDGVTVTQRAQAGDEEALAIFRNVGDALATGVFNLVHCFMPERVVIGGGVSQAGDLLLGPVRELLATGCGPSCPTRTVEVVVAEGGDDVGLLGAYAFWLDSSRADAEAST